MFHFRLPWPKTWRSLLLTRNERGSIAVTFALSVTAVVFVAACAIQIGLISSTKAKFQSAADTAALAAISPSTANADMETVAQTTFYANLTQQEKAAITSLTISTTTGRVREAVVTYAVNQAALVPGLVGNVSTAISGTAKARKADYRYVDIDLWLDGSGSMGVAADEAGRDALRALSAQDPQHANCAFACHIPTQLKESNLYSTSEQRAHANGIKLRHDIMKESVQILIDELEDAYPRGLRARYGVARMANQWERMLDFTSDAPSARSYVGTFQLYPDWNGSRLTPSMQTGRDTLSYGAGDGSQGDPEKFIILVTDGMQFNWGGDVVPGPLSTSVCNEIKAKGYRLAVVQLRYVRLDGDSAFDYWVAPVYDLITPALEACASTGYYFHADDPDEVRNAFRQLAQTLEESLRLTE